MATSDHAYHPELTNAGLDAAAPATALDEFGQPRDGHIAAERALTIYLDKREIVTLMTLGTKPELLILGWLHNQRLITNLEQIRCIQVDWITGSAAVITYDGVEGLDEKLG
ncbi:MAG: sulfurtransferase FdhD, partial [Gammaproteobacteria bacterium]|nr:sulfurtransferase FdhD [Gammaproteobacteria bacterium]